MNRGPISTLSEVTRMKKSPMYGDVQCTEVLNWAGFHWSYRRVKIRTCAQMKYYAAIDQKTLENREILI